MTYIYIYIYINTGRKNINCVETVNIIYLTIHISTRTIEHSTPIDIPNEFIRHYRLMKKLLLTFFWNRVALN